MIKVEERSADALSWKEEFENCFMLIALCSSSSMSDNLELRDEFHLAFLKRSSLHSLLLVLYKTAN